MHRIFTFFILIAVFALGIFLGQEFLKQAFSNISKFIPSNVITRNIIQRSSCDSDCKKEIEEEVKKAIASALPKESTPTVSTSTSTKNQTSFISLEGPYLTTATDWVDVPGAQVTLDLINDYGSKTQVSWESSLKVAHGNGQAFARLFDSTNGIAVSGSEISTTDNMDYKSAASGNLYLWSGRNTYKVQVKSLNSFEVGYTGGKLKISY